MSSLFLPGSQQQEVPKRYLSASSFMSHTSQTSMPHPLSFRCITHLMHPPSDDHTLFSCWCTTPFPLMTTPPSCWCATPFSSDDHMLMCHTPFPLMTTPFSLVHPSLWCHTPSLWCATPLLLTPSHLWCATLYNSLPWTLVPLCARQLFHAIWLMVAPADHRSILWNSSLITLKLISLNLKSPQHWATGSCCHSRMRTI